MADLVATKPPGHSGYAGAVVTFTAANNADQEAAFEPGIKLIVRNSGAGGHNFTVYSAPAPQTARLHNIVESIGAGAVKIYGPFPANGWKQSNGKLKFKGVHAELLIAVIRPD